MTLTMLESKSHPLRDGLTEQQQQQEQMETWNHKSTFLLESRRGAGPEMVHVFHYIYIYISQLLWNLLFFNVRSQVICHGEVRTNSEGNGLFARSLRPSFPQPCAANMSVDEALWRRTGQGGAISLTGSAPRWQKRFRGSMNHES